MASEACDSHRRNVCGPWPVAGGRKASFRAFVQASIKQFTYHGVLHESFVIMHILVKIEHLLSFLIVMPFVYPLCKLQDRAVFVP